LKEWTANGCSLNVGKKMMTTHLFKRLDIKEILFVGGKSTLELSFRERNFQTLGLLMGHPQSSQIDADYFAQAINSAWFHTDNSQNYLSDLVKALMDFLPNDLLKNIRNHKNLWDPAKSVIDNNQIKHCWRLFLTALSVSAQRPKNHDALPPISTSLNLLTRNKLYDPRIPSIVKEFLI